MSPSTAASRPGRGGWWGEVHLAPPGAWLSLERLAASHAMTISHDDPDAVALAERYPNLRRIGERLKIESGPLAGEPVVIRRRLTERGGVLFTLRYDDGRIRDWEWWD